MTCLNHMDRNFIIFYYVCNLNTFVFFSYDIVLDCAGKGADYASQFPAKFDHYVTFSSPLLRNIDSFGLGAGSVRNLCNLIETNFKSFSSQKGLVKWGYFVPAPHAIDYLKTLVNRKKVTCKKKDYIILF